MSIFVDELGLPVKFFIQKDLPDDVQVELTEKIANLGGRVEQKVPRQGFVLVQFGTPEEIRLRICWKAADRPDRFFVPYTYIEACRISGKLLKQIFIHEGQPIKFHIHPSIANVNVRAELSDRIRHSGGDPTATAQDARVILADHATDVFGHLVKTYQGVPEKYIESIHWIDKCISTSSVSYTPSVYKNPGGRRAGEERTQFTSADEENLCSWIAAKIPYKETGGRTGNRLYQQLCEMAHHPDYSWVTRHTWQSWRERYKKNSGRLDGMIAAIVDQRRPIVGEKGQYGYVRASEEQVKKPKRGKRNRSLAAEEQESAVSGPSGEVGEQLVHMPILHPESLMYPPTIPGPYMPPPGSGPMDPVAGPLLRDGNEVQVETDENEWTIRVGEAPAPLWARREPAGQNNDESGLRKRARLDQITAGISEVASRFRFTVEEVDEYYNRVGQDLDRTRRRFGKMRGVLMSLSDEE